MLNNSYDEGLGTVYERIMLNRYFDSLLEKYEIKHVLETPIFGMTGLTGINSVEFAVRGRSVTLVDKSPTIISAIELWNTLSLPFNAIELDNFDNILLENKTFDLVWNFAALWHLEKAPLLVNEMCRLSKNLVLIFVQNTHQPGYWIRKCCKMIPKGVNEEWLNIRLYEKTLISNGYRIVQRGYIDIPPFPDVASPIGKKIKSDWDWNIIDYYMGKDKGLLERIKKYEFLEKTQCPLWAHHKFILGQKV